MDPIPFSGSPLDRECLRRRDREWLDARLADSASRFLPVWQAKPLLKRDPRERAGPQSGPTRSEPHASGGGPLRRLAWAKREFFEDLETPEPVFLGSDDGVAHFAIDVSAAEKPEVAFGIADVASFDDLRAAVALLPAADAAIAAHARTLLDWHARHRHCAACGGHTRSVLGGANRVCFDCQAEHFPRTDPVAIAVVVRGDQCLLGRGPGWPAKLFSALAGFVEAGESLEDAVRREVFEEAGVRVGEVTYLASQPWPFPSSLMLGCVGQAESEKIAIDPAELDEARWFSRAALRAALQASRSEPKASEDQRLGQRHDLAVPPPLAIAHHLIRAWVESDAGG
ncbi:MAG TPA: NAD(+) diphosphatase [Myxococcota bacterium]|nr:NAD(+) diphosphatase [Myxococcota bacterium]